MAAVFFGEFLLSKGIISQDVLDQAIELQRKSNLLLGEIAVSSGMITRQQAADINLRQQIENRKFGEIAQKLGLLGEHDIQNLLNLQKKQRKYFGDILLDLGMVGRDQLLLLLNEHENLQDQAYQDLLAKIDQHPLEPFLTCSIATMNQIFTRLLHVRSKFCQLLTPEHPLFFCEASCQISLGEEPAFTVTLATNLHSAAIIASKFTFQPIEDCDEAFCIDALGEFLNIMTGHLAENIVEPDEYGYLDKPQRSLVELTPDYLTTAQNDPLALAVEITSSIGSLLLMVSQADPWGK